MYGKILVTLDSIFDTRLALTKRLDPVLAKEMFTSPHYRERNIDWWKKKSKLFTEKMWDEAYAKRDASTVLQFSIRTGMLDYITDVIDSQITGEDGLPCFNGDVDYELIVDVEPYVLTPDEQSYLVACLRTYMPLIANIRLVNLGMQWSTPDTLRSNEYKYFILHDINEWLSYHEKTIATKHYPDLTLVCPKIYLKKLPDEPRLKEFLEKHDFFAYVEAMYLHRIGFTFISSKYYSAT